MKSVLSAELTILVHLKSVGVILLVLHCVVISLLAFSARQCDLYSHSFTPPVLSVSGISILRSAFLFLFVMRLYAKNCT